MEEQSLTHWNVKRISELDPLEVDDVIAREFPLTIILNGEEFATMLCTPTHLEELVIGFLAGEGAIRSYDDIASLSVNESQGFVYVQLKKEIELDQKAYSKRYVGSCCGKSRQFYFKNDVLTARTIMTNFHVTPLQCYNLMEKLRLQSEDFSLTGGVHNAALATVDDLIITRMDIGRHNTLDKLYGYCLKNHINMRDKLIIFSGRISSEVLLKAAKMGVGLFLSKSAPTDLALKLAEDLGITSVGFIRGDHMNIYTHPERVDVG